MTTRRTDQAALIAIALLLALANLTAQSPAAAAAGLARLTAPTQHLPNNCRLEPVGTDANGKPIFVMSPGRLDANPWIGSRHPTMALIREMVEGPPKDEGLVGPAALAQSAKGLVEGYRARYVTPGGGKVEVYAVRFDDPALTARAAIRSLGGEVPRIVFDATAVRVTWSAPGARIPTTDTESCYRAVRGYVSSLK